MKRVAFKMHLKPGQMKTYKKRHHDLWPELKTFLKEAGIKEYTIFLDEETHTLFAFQKVEGDSGSQDLGTSDIVKKWWSYMADIMETNEDQSPVSTLLTEVFHLK